MWPFMEGAMELQLTPEERHLLAEIIEERYRELRKEIFRTDHHDFKVVLRERERMLERLLEKLGVEQGVSIAR
jgi:hypothetical protein